MKNNDVPFLVFRRTMDQTLARTKKYLKKNILKIFLLSARASRRQQIVTIKKAF